MRRILRIRAMANRCPPFVARTGTPYSPMCKPIPPSSRDVPGSSSPCGRTQLRARTHGRYRPAGRTWPRCPPGPAALDWSLLPDRPSHPLHLAGLLPRQAVNPMGDRRLQDGVVLDRLLGGDGPVGCFHASRPADPEQVVMHILWIDPEALRVAGSAGSGTSPVAPVQETVSGSVPNG